MFFYYASIPAGPAPANKLLEEVRKLMTSLGPFFGDAGCVLLPSER